MVVISRLVGCIVAVATTVGAASTAAAHQAIADSDGLNGLFLVLLAVALTFGAAVAYLMMKGK
jgi:hypothetical protein